MPKLLKTPFAIDAAEGFRTDIQESTGVAPNSATYQVGFPPNTMQSLASGGMPPKGSDLNGVLYDITDNLVFLTQGRGYGFDSAYAASIGGYPLNARLRLTSGDIVKSTIDGNTNDPNADMTGWVLVNSDSQITTWSGRTQEQENKALAKSVFYHIDNLEDAEKYTGYIVEYRGKHFKVSVEPSKDIRHPVIMSGNSYLIPIDHTTLSFKTGNLYDRGVITSPEYFGKYTHGKSQQGLLIDNSNNSAFITSIFVDSTFNDCTVLEYDFSNGSIGGVKAISGVISLGHGDHYAITQREGIRHLWYYKPPVGSDQYGVDGTIVCVPWANGCSDGDAIVEIAVTNFDVSRRLEVTNFDDENLLIRGATNNIVSIDDLYNGSIVVKDRRSFDWTPNTVEIVQPRQQSKSICNSQIALSGVFIKQDKSAYYSASAIDGSEFVMQKLHKSSASEDEEVEGVCHWWNQNSLQFEPIVTTWEWQNGIVRLYNLVAARKNNQSLFTNTYLSTPTGGQTDTGFRNVLETPMNFGCSAIFIGGSQSPVRQADGVGYDISKFFAEQWSTGRNGRYGARIVYDNASVLLDGSKDTELPSGIRIQIDDNVIFQARGDGVNIGLRRSKTQEQLARLNVSQELKPAIFASALQNDMPSYVSESTRLDFASTGSLKLGGYNTATNVATRWAYLNASAFTSYTDNTMDLGTASLRFKNSYFSTAPTVSSDERLKQQFRNQTESEKAAALEIKNSICLYKFNDAVDLKGDGARWHVGVKAQQVIGIMQSHGLNPFEYGFVCFDQWQETDEHSVGDRYAIRYDELAMFIFAAI